MTTTLSLRVCIDVDSVDRAIAFYTQGLGLTLAHRRSPDWAELSGAPVPIDLLEKTAGTAPSPGAASRRDYARHWTPLHLDLVTRELDAAVARAVAAGAVLEQPIQERAWGRMANLGDPFGHGFCLLEFKGRGYDEPS